MKFIKSLYDKNFYNDVVNNQKLSKAIWYWIGISLLLVISSMIYGGIYIKEQIPIFIEEAIPYFSVEDGILEIEKPIYLGIAPPDGDVADLNLDYEGTPMVIDPSFEYKEEEFKLFPNYLVATRDRVYLKGSEGVQELPYSEIDWLNNINRDQLFEKLKSEIPELKEILIPIIISALFLFLTFSFLYLSINILGMLILTLIGLLFSAILKKGLVYKDVLIITLYSRTLPLLISCALILYIGEFFNIFIPLIHIALLGYFISTINKVEIKQNTPVQNTQTNTSPSPVPLQAQTPNPPLTQQPKEP